MLSHSLQHHSCPTCCLILACDNDRGCDANDSKDEPRAPAFAFVNSHKTPVLRTGRRKERGSLAATWSRPRELRTEDTVSLHPGSTAHKQPRRGRCLRQRTARKWNVAITNLKKQVTIDNRKAIGARKAAREEEFSSPYLPLQGAKHIKNKSLVEHTLLRTNVARLMEGNSLITRQPSNSNSQRQESNKRTVHSKGEEQVTSNHHFRIAAFQQYPLHAFPPSLKRNHPIAIAEETNVLSQSFSERIVKKVKAESSHERVIRPQPLAQREGSFEKPNTRINSNKSYQSQKQQQKYGQSASQRSPRVAKKSGEMLMLQSRIQSAQLTTRQPLPHASPQFYHNVDDCQDRIASRLHPPFPPAKQRTTLDGIHVALNRVVPSLPYPPSLKNQKPAGIFAAPHPSNNEAVEGGGDGNLTQQFSSEQEKQENNSMVVETSMRKQFQLGHRVKYQRQVRAMDGIAKMKFRRLNTTEKQGQFVRNLQRISWTAAGSTKDFKLSRSLLNQAGAERSPSDNEILKAYCCTAAYNPTLCRNLKYNEKTAGH